MKEQESSREAVLRLMQDGVQRTDGEIADLTGLPAGKASGARNTLWEQGLVEPMSKQSKQEHTRWRICPAERQAEAQQAWRDNRERRTLGRLMQKSPGERANIAIHLLRDDEVNEALMAQLDRSRAWRRARARSRDIRRDRQAERKLRRAELRQAMDEAETDLKFRQTISNLRDLQDVLYVVGREIEVETARQSKGEKGRIAADSWRSVARTIREVLEVGQSLYRDLADLMHEPLESCPLCGERLHSPAAHLDKAISMRWWSKRSTSEARDGHC